MSDPADVVRELWLRHRDITLGRLARVHEALAKLGAGELSDEERAEATTDAHRLRGILGTYGFPEGTELAGQAEDALADGTTPSRATELGALVAAYAATL